MQAGRSGWLLSTLLLPALCAAVIAHAVDSQGPTLALNSARRAASDLEIGGDLAKQPAGTTRYVPLDALLRLPLATYTVVDDPNFSGATKISGVPLDQLPRLLGAAPRSDLVVAICEDKYRAYYPRAYVAAHHPLLVFRINGEPPLRWPKDPETHRYSMGPYMISHPRFTASFAPLVPADEPQIPWGVVRLEFRDERTVFGAIAPRGPRAGDRSVQVGYQVARQDCFRCHNQAGEGGQKSGRPWLVLAAWAAAAPDFFADYVRDPRKRNTYAEMPGNTTYDGTTLSGLRDYFATFVAPGRP